MKIQEKEQWPGEPGLFTIGIPAFKGRFLAECIESILSQTYKHFELIIVNDCSPDDIRALVSKYNDNRINYYENDHNIGAEHVVDNWNKCLSYAKGEYFVLMGDDDKMEPDYLEEFMKLIRKYPGLDVYHCRSKIINENSVPYKLTFSCPEYESTHNYIWHVLNGKRDQYISDFTYRTIGLIAKKGFYKLPLAWTSDYVTAFIASGEKGIAHSNKAVFNYRISAYNITSNSSADLKRQAMIGYENWFKEFLLAEPLNEEDKILYPLIQNSVVRLCKNSKLSFVHQKIVSEGFKGLIQCWVKRKAYSIEIKDIISVIVRTLSSKI